MPVPCPCLSSALARVLVAERLASVLARDRQARLLWAERKRCHVPEGAFLARLLEQFGHRPVGVATVFLGRRTA